MYFSVISPAKERVRAAMRDLAHSSYGQHQWMWKFFGGGAEAERDFIFRSHEVDTLLKYYVVSARAPLAFSDDWEVRSRAYDPLPPVGQRLSFVLCANPVVSKKDASGKSRRHDVVMQAKRQTLADYGMAPDAGWRALAEYPKRPRTADLVEQSCFAWLQARAANAGFELVDATVDSYQQQRARKRDAKQEIRFSSVEFSGELVVTDPQRFQQTLLNGLGHAKAFGCGLLLVKKIGE